MESAGGADVWGESGDGLGDVVDTERVGDTTPETAARFGARGRRLSQLVLTALAQMLPTQLMRAGIVTPQTLLR